MTLLSTLHVEEDGGLAALLGTSGATLAREAALREGAVLEAARDLLQTAFADQARRGYLDPFAPAAERSAERSARRQGRLSDGPTSMSGSRA